MINMHYPPDIEALLLMATTDPKNPCLHLLMCKLGLASGHETDHIVWTERIYLQTSLELRAQNKDRPYEALYDPADLERCSQLNREISERATYGARLLVNKQVVLEDFARAEADSDWILFTMPLPGGEFVPIYEQQYHGAVNIKTAQFHFGSYHTEGVLRDNISDKGLLLADTIVNVFAVLAGITTVQPRGFANYKKSKLTDPSLLRSVSDNDGTGSVLDCAIQMRWVEKKRDHRFLISQLSDAMMFYVDKEGIILDENSVRTPVAQILSHIGRKGYEAQRATGFNLQQAGLDAQRAAGFPNLAANREAQRAAGFNLQQAGLDAQRAAGFPTIAANREAQRAAGFPGLAKGRETQLASGFNLQQAGRDAQRAAGFPGLIKGNETQRAAGFPGLAKGRETQRADGYAGTKKALEALHAVQRAAGWPSLVRGREISRATGFQHFREYDKKRQRVYYDKLQIDIEATNKRKAAEDPSFEPPPVKKFEQRVVKKKRGTIPCTIKGCKSKLSNEDTLKDHLSLTHGLWSLERPYQCPDEGCHRYYATEDAAKEHNYVAHTRGKVECPTCGRKMTVRHLPEHRRDMHGWGC
jgi:hypothetical protein